MKLFRRGEYMAVEWGVVRDRREKYPLASGDSLTLLVDTELLGDYDILVSKHEYCALRGDFLENPKRDLRLLLT